MFLLWGKITHMVTVHPSPTPHASSRSDVDTPLRVSVVMTVFNERAALPRLLDSLAAQTLPPHEIIICDGGSRDGTPDVIREYVKQRVAGFPPVQLIEEPGANISRGRNLAIAAAAGPVIACTDAGVRLAADWLENLVAPFVDETPSPTPSSLEGEGLRDERVNEPRNEGMGSTLAVAGFFEPDARGVFQTALAATTLPTRDEIDPCKFLPSSRSVAFLKAAWSQAGGYPEWLDYCEDLLFDFALNAQRPHAPTAFAWAPRATVYFQPRPSWRQFWTQYYRYARGDGKADLWRKRHALRYFIYSVLIPALLGHGLRGVFARWLGWAGLLAGGIAYCRRPWRRLSALGGGLSPSARLRAAALVPLMRAVGDVAKMVGYPVGLWWRWRNRHRPEIHWRKP